MKCPFCGNSSHKVIDKRMVISSGDIRRRRECLKCTRRFTTYEKIAGVDLLVIKKDGRKEVFVKEKLLAGIIKSLEKRPALEYALDVVERIERKLRQKSRKEITSKQIGKMVLAELKKLDSVAYLRFASVYRQFGSPEDFAKEASSLAISNSSQQ